MTIRLYLDEDTSDTALVRALRARGVDVEPAKEAGMTKRGDQEHLEYATAQGRALVSFNRGDYCRLHTDWLTQGKSHAGIILATQQRHTIGERVRRLLNLATALSAQDMQNRLEFLTNWPP